MIQLLDENDKAQIEQKIKTVSDETNSLKSDLADVNNNIEGTAVIAIIAKPDSSNKVDIMYDGILVGIGITTKLKLSGGENVTLIVQSRNETTALGQKNVEFIDGIAEVSFGVGDRLRINGYSNEVYVLSDKNTIGKRVEVLEKFMSENYNNAENGTPDKIRMYTGKKIKVTNAQIGYIVFENCDITFDGNQTYTPIGDVIFNNCTLKFLDGAVLNVSNSSFRLGINGENNIIIGSDCLFSSPSDTRKANKNFFANDVPITILKNGYWLDGETQQYVGRFNFWSEVVVYFLVNKDLYLYSEADDLAIPVKLKGYGKDTRVLNTIFLGDHAKIKNIFVHSVVLEGSDIKIEQCYFVNGMIISNKKTSNRIEIVDNVFVGQNARIQLGALVDSVIDRNDFQISNPAFPDATPRTNGEQSRNIFARSIKRCHITNNRMHCGRTGLCVLGDNTFGLGRTYSSIGNVITGNIIEGIGEEYISFDGGNVLDVGYLDDIVVEFEQVDTQQLVDGRTDTQKKWIAVVTVNIHSDILATSGVEDGKHIKNYTDIANNGIFIVNASNSDYYEVTDYTIGGEIVSDEDYNYSSDGKYSVTFNVPTSFTVDLTPTEDQKTSIENTIKERWAIGTLVFVGEVAINNVITGNYINGIGTDLFTSPSNMGGICLYINSFNNVVADNTLFERRIWLQRWNMKDSKSKLKIQSHNVISNNVIQNSGLSVLSYGDSWEALGKNYGNKLIGNVINGGTDRAKIALQHTEKTTMVANSANECIIEYTEDSKFIGNTVISPSVQGYGGNSNNKQDTTDDLIFPVN